MARLRKGSPVLETANQPLAGLKSFKNPPDFSPNLTVAGYEAKIGSVSGKLDAYNQALASIDQLLNEFQSEEAELNDLNRRFLSAGEAHFGPDSSEYEMLGGTRKSERKRPTRKGGGVGHPRRHRKSATRASQCDGGQRGTFIAEAVGFGLNMICDARS